MWVDLKNLTLLVKTQTLALVQIFIEKRTLALNIDEKQVSTNISSFLPRCFCYNIYYLAVYILKSQLRTLLSLLVCIVMPASAGVMLIKEMLHNVLFVVKH